MSEQATLQIFEEALKTPGGVAIHHEDKRVLSAVRWRLYSLRRAQRRLHTKVYGSAAGVSRFDDLVISLVPSMHGWSLKICTEADMYRGQGIKIEPGAGAG